MHCTPADWFQQLQSIRKSNPSDDLRVYGEICRSRLKRKITDVVGLETRSTSALVKRRQAANPVEPSTKQKLCFGRSPSPQRARASKPQCSVFSCWSNWRSADCMLILVGRDFSVATRAHLLQRQLAQPACSHLDSVSLQSTWVTAARCADNHTHPTLLL